jgi:hypothetical protein
MSMTTYAGHAPGHVHDTFEQAVEKMVRWDGIGPEPTVAFEVNYEPRQITLAQACTLVSRCSDQLPGWICDNLEEFGLKRDTYAAGARAMRRWLKQREQVRQLA